MKTSPDDPSRRTECEMFGTMEVLQSVEDALVDNGWKEFMVAGKHGTWTWVKDPADVEVIVHDCPPYDPEA